MLDDIEAQRIALSRLPDKRFIQTSSQVKGPYTSGGYIIWMLNSILGPDNWRHTLVHGPEIVRLSESQAYVQVTVRLDAQFANGNQVTHEDVGVWPLAATNAKAGGTLDDTAPERYETVLKACVTDGLKACAEYLGVCFRPLADQNLTNVLSALTANGGAPKADTTNGKVDTRNFHPETASLADLQNRLKDKAAEERAAQAKPSAQVTDEARKPTAPASNGVRKQASLKCALKEFDRLCTDLARNNPRYQRTDGTPDKAHMLYTLHACGFPVLTDANLEPAFEAAARHAAGLPASPAADDGCPF